MKRYEKINCTDDDGNMYASIITENPEGEWVKYSEAEGIINKLTEQNKEMKCRANQYAQRLVRHGDDDVIWAAIDLTKKGK